MPFRWRKNTNILNREKKTSKTSVPLENISLQTDVFRLSNFQKFNDFFLDDLDFRYTNVKSGCFADN